MVRSLSFYARIISFGFCQRVNTALTQRYSLGCCVSSVHRALRERAGFIVAWKGALCSCVKLSTLRFLKAFDDTSGQRLPLFLLLLLLLSLVMSALGGENFSKLL